MAPTAAGPPAGGRSGPTLASDSFSVARWTLVSRLTGFGRVAAIAAVLGPTHFGNLFQTANLLPNVTYEFLTGSLVASLLVPSLVRHLDGQRRADASRVAGGFLGLALVAMVVVAAAVVVAAPLVLRVLAVGVDDPAVAADQRRVGVLFMALLMPQVVLYGIAGVGAAVQNAYGRFALPAAAPVLENLGVIATVLVSAAVFGAGIDVGAASTGQVLLLGFGSTAAVALHAGAQWWGARRAGITLVPRWGWRDPEVRRLVRLAVPSVGYTGLNAARQFGVLIVSNAVPGGVIAFQLALNFFNLPVALGAKPCAVALLPRLARSHQDGDEAGFAQEFGRGVRLASFLTVPAAVAYVVLAWPLARAFSFGEMATPVGVSLVAISLGAVAVGMIGDGVFWVSTNACYARGEAGTPLRAMALRVLLVSLGVVAILSELEGTGVLLALGLTVAAADLAGGAYLTSRVRRRLPPVAPRLVRDAVTTVLSLAAMAVPLAILSVLIDPQRRVASLAGVGLAGMAGFTLYLLVQRLRGSTELAALLEVVRPRSTELVDRA